jgi:orotate phosphoribosyltransferase
VLIVDDVISAGTSVRESVNLIRASNAIPCGVVIALDRMERGSGALSAVQEVGANYNIPVISIATLDDLMTYLRTEPQHAQHLAALGRYRDQYGVTTHA